MVKCSNLAVCSYQVHTYPLTICGPFHCPHCPLSTVHCPPPPRDGVSYTLQLHSLRLLLAMTSSQLYTMDAAGPPGSHPFADAILAQESLRAPLLQALLRAIVQRPLPPRHAEVSAGEAALVERKSSQGRKGSQGLARSARASVMRCCMGLGAHTDMRL